MRKWVLLKKYGWSAVYHIDEWFDFRCDAIDHARARMAKTKDELYRLIEVSATADRFEQIELPGPSPLDTHPDAVIGDGVEKALDRADQLVSEDD